MPTREPSSSGPSPTTTHLRAPRKRNWIRRLPQIIKKRKHDNPNPSFGLIDTVRSPIGLLALFRRRVAPAILIEMQADPANAPLTAAQDDDANIPPTPVQGDPADISLAAAREDLTDTSPTTPQQQIAPRLVPYEVDERESSCASFVSFDST